MPDVKNALVFPCGSEIGLELRRALGSSRHFRLVGATSTADHGAYAYADLENLPRVDAAGFLPAFEALLSRREIDFVLPAHDEVLIRLAEWAAAGGSGAEIIAPPVEVCRLCRSKNATYAFFADKLPTPRRFSPADLDRAPYPLFMKPDAGQGGRGAALVGDAAAAREKLRQSPADLILEYLPGREYTIDCFTDRRRRLLYAAGRIRNRVANGISVDSRDCPDPRFQPLAESINQAIQLRGAWFFQLREDAAGTLRLLEIAPRIAGTSGLRRVMGVNLPLLSLYDRLGLEVELIDNRLAGTAVDRALASVYRAPLDFATVYMDLDDTLTAGDGVNP
ncbi:MAG: ATP-grasp domain-containing protein, partial [Planctomycetota bacterium]|nr:ATP-grasp domain-containing protein [Planctomycetota bacterium]